MGRYEDVDLTEAVKGDRRSQLTALRDYLAHELEGNRCNNCRMSQLRTGDTAALVLRLQNILKEIDELPREDGVVSDLDRIRARKAARTPNATDLPPAAKRRFSGSGDN
jgi:hypothetical protein